MFMFSKILYEIKKDLNSRTDDPELFFAKCVNARLNKGLDAYNDYLDNSIKYLSKKNATTVVKRI